MSGARVAPNPARYNVGMVRDMVVRVFDAFSEAEAASRAQYAAATPDERLALVLELGNRYREENLEASGRLARVYRVVELERR